MILIIAAPEDVPALWLKTQLARRSAVPVRLVTPARLACSPSISHRLAGDDDEFFAALFGEEPVRGDSLTGVVNRFRELPAALFDNAVAEDRAYAASELLAFTLGWLASLPCPVINPPAPLSLAGSAPPPMVALNQAAVAGLAVPATRLSSASPAPPAAAPAPGTTSHCVLDGRLFGPILPSDDRDALLQFARLWGDRLVQIDTSPGTPRYFRGASGFADFRHGGEALVQALARALGG